MSTAPAYKKAAAVALDRHLPGLDGLRGVACLLVFVYHLRWLAGDPPLFVGNFRALSILKNCDIGVAIFFALSGLLLSIPFWRAMQSGASWPDFRRYFWRRACRIVPAYYACLLVVYLFRGGTYTFHGFIDFLLHAGFVHTFSDQSYLSVHGLLWTIGLEFQFYLFLPVMMAGLAWLARRIDIRIACMALFTATLLLQAAASAAIIAIEPLISDRFLGPGGIVISCGTIFHFLPFFALGMLGGGLCLFWRDRQMRAAPLVWGCLALSGTIGILLFSNEGAWRQDFTWMINMAVFSLLAASLPAAPALARFFEARPLVFAGQISYGIYLWHELVLRAVFSGTIRGQLAGWPLVLAGGAIALAVTVLVAWLSYRMIERPAMKVSYPFATASTT